MGLFDFFKSSKEESPRTQEPTWDPNTMTMQQPSSPSAPVVDRAVSEQPNTQEQMQLRGGGAGDCCCGICAGILCFECCEECC
ncbi:hypothetical protein F9C07_10375 [Aspergillus flavus]|uniref:Cysteine-rich transmembrane CYSTM domain-containing protein n=2 Tax=Aspergillus subgen. Circumdati TaxID=2720871 RepID=A0A7G5K7F8_ASPFN|nr:hypothetical protein AFLA_011638 [Aspergillus flavus NRRL3357]PIG82023.1 hypothetical protein AARAC_010269 [Aspergillus arachidicola]QMW43800.1 hypothetical protein G4B11_007170 [Aspergillus flavus]QRD90819.1 hypothetical protein F9C07_10375 [Aspergillus flavus]